MNNTGDIKVDTPFGRRAPDSVGAPLGVVRMETEKSYAGVGELLGEFINHGARDAWDQICTKIDYTFESLDLALSPLEHATHFGDEIRSRLERGLKLLFKPNLVNIQCIDPQTHGPDYGSTACTEWPFVAALMRWFHEKFGISYHQMALGEAASVMPAASSVYTMLHPAAKHVTTEAVIEGRCGDFYGGWGFYFARKYLAERLAEGAGDDPMQGHEESISGAYIPPGLARDKLMVYDLNRIFDDSKKGREIEVADGVNFRSITLHKAVVGGRPGDTEDRSAYPGCVLVNVPKFKVHAITLFTNAIKNLGIGLYPMQSTREGGTCWEYSVPHTATPGIKAAIPHEIWVPRMDPISGRPTRDSDGRIQVKKTGGINATMIDIIKAVNSQEIFMIHVVDGVEAINLDHMGMGVAAKVPEGMIFAGLDPVALDQLCARYMFSNVPLRDALEVELTDGAGGRFPQAVPVPVVEGRNIVTQTGYDCPLARDKCLENAEKRGLGRRLYHVLGHDRLNGSDMVSVEGHLGFICNGSFQDVITSTLYFDVFKMPWDLQRTFLSYLEAVDRLTGTSLRKAFMDTFDDNGDGVVTYEEAGKGIWTHLLFVLGDHSNTVASEPMGYLKGQFNTNVRLLASNIPSTSSGAMDLPEAYGYGAACVAALQISQMEIEAPDPFVPGLSWGKGKWPSLQLARFFRMGVAIYGAGFPYRITHPSLYSTAFVYADRTQNESRYTGKIRNAPDDQALERYLSGISSGGESPLDFTLYVPPGYENLSGNEVPNVEVADDPSRALTVAFSGGAERWPPV